MARTTPRWVATSLLVVATAACSSGPDVTRPEMRDDVRAAVEEAVDQLTVADLRPVRASGRYTVCEESGYEYRAGALLRPAGDLGAAIEDAEYLLADNGWEVEKAEDGPVPFVQLTRGALEGDLKESVLHPGRVELGIDHDCIDGDRDDTPSFDSEPIDVR